MIFNNSVFMFKFDCWVSPVTRYSTVVFNAFAIFTASSALGRLLCLRCPLYVSYVKPKESKRGIKDKLFAFTIFFTRS